MYLVTIDEDKCEGCGECAEACPVDVISMVDGKAYVEDSSECLGCESCMAVCPTEAVKVQEM
ncbi:MAG: 4Fe-4S binding protein [Bacillota bacterium]